MSSYGLFLPLANPVNTAVLRNFLPLHGIIGTNKHAGSIKGGEFFDQLQYQFFRKIVGHLVSLNSESCSDHES
jgi:hypothetical protein